VRDGTSCPPATRLQLLLPLLISTDAISAAAMADAAATAAASAATDDIVRHQGGSALQL